MAEGHFKASESGEHGPRSASTRHDPLRAEPLQKSICDLAANGAFCEQICKAAVQLAGASHVRAVLITAEGKAFRYGGDVSAFVNDPDALPNNIRPWTTDLHGAIARLQRMDAPVVAAVQGVFAGGGWLASSQAVT